MQAYKKDAQFIANVLMRKGWTPVQVSGIIGHLIQESGLRTTLTGGAGERGMGQWLGTRYDALVRFAAERGTRWDNMETQALFIDYEMRTAYEAAKKRGVNDAALVHEALAFHKLQQARTVRDAVEAFMHFERPQGYSIRYPQGGHGWNNRLSNAEQMAGMLNFDQGPTIVRATNPEIEQEVAKLRAAADKGDASARGALFVANLANDLLGQDLVRTRQVIAAYQGRGVAAGPRISHVEEPRRMVEEDPKITAAALPREPAEGLPRITTAILSPLDTDARFHTSGNNHDVARILAAGSELKGVGVRATESDVIDGGAVYTVKKPQGITHAII